LRRPRGTRQRRRRVFSARPAQENPQRRRLRFVHPERASAANDSRDYIGQFRRSVGMATGRVSRSSQRDPVVTEGVGAGDAAACVAPIGTYQIFKILHHLTLDILNK
jgi:hypothetical protein